MLGHERGHLPTDLQVRHVTVELDPVQALKVQRHMTIEQIIHRHRHRCSHSHSLNRTRRARPAPASAVRGEASLGVC
jgi:hypothetical protein